MFGFNLNLIGGIALAGAVATGAAYIKGRWDGASAERVAAQISAFQNAAKRVQTMEQNDEAFRTLSERDRCRALARDSRLPESACD